MKMGQAMLAVGALVLLVNVSMSINRSMINTVTDTIEYQVELDAINYGQSIMEGLFLAATQYDTENHENDFLSTYYLNLNDVTDEHRRLMYVNEYNDTLYATIEFSDHDELVHGEIDKIFGRHIIVSVFIKKENNFIQKAGYMTAISPLNQEV